MAPALLRRSTTAEAVLVSVGSAGIGHTVHPEVSALHRPPSSTLVEPPVSNPRAPIARRSCSPTSLLLLSGHFVPLALALLAAELYNILAFHLSFAPAGIPPAPFVSAIWNLVFLQYRPSFKDVLAANPMMQEWSASLGGGSVSPRWGTVSDSIPHCYESED